MEPPHPQHKERQREEMSLYEQAIKAIRKLHGDTSVGMRETLDNLKGLRDELDVFIEAVEKDIEREESK